MAQIEAGTSFAEALRRLRLARGLTQEELAERAGLSPRGVSDLERGARRIPHRETVALLARALGLSEEEAHALLQAARRNSFPPAHTETDGPGVARQPPSGNYLGAAPEGRLCGRVSDLAAILDWAAAARCGAGRLGLLIGEAGAGKTRLAQEVACALRARGFLVVTGRSYENQQALAYSPFVEALSAAYAKAPESTQLEAPHRWPHMARLLPDIWADWGNRADASYAETVAGPDVWGVEQQRLHWHVAGFLRALASGRPVALLLDDLHWADASSLALLQHLARHLHEDPIFLLGTCRSDALRAGQPMTSLRCDLTREGLLECLTLQPLNRTETAALICQTLGEPLGEPGKSAVADEVVDRLQERASGLPLFLRELARALVDQGEIVREDGRWHWRMDAALGVEEMPQTIRAVVAQRLAPLSAEAREMLYTASVLGQSFSFDELAGVGHWAADDLEPVIDEALQAGLLREVQFAGHAGRCLGYTFPHALIQQTLYAGLPSRRRARLHRFAGETIERIAGRGRDRRAAELARHFREGAAPEQALPYTLAAGDSAVAVFAHAEAQRHYRGALSLALQVEDQAGIALAAERCADMLVLAGSYTEARQSYTEALDHTPLVDRIQLCVLWTKIGGTAMAQRDTAEAARAYQKAQTLLGEQPLSPENAWWQAWIEQRLALLMLLYWQMQHAEMARLLDAMREPITAHGSATQRSEYYHAITRMRNTRERFVPSDETLASAEASLACLSEAHPLHLLLSARFNLAFVHLWRGELAEAEAGLGEVARRAERGGDAYFELLSLTYLAVLFRKLGRLEEVERYAARSLECAQRQQVASYIAVAHANLGWLARRRGDLDAAQRFVDEGLAGLVGGNYPLLWVAACPALALALSRADTSDAIKLSRQLLTPTQQLLPVTLRTAVERAIQAWEAGAAAGARGCLAEAMAAAYRDGYV